MSFFRKKKSDEQKKLHSDFMKSLDLESKFEDFCGDEQPDEVVIYDLEGNVLEVRRDESRRPS